MISKHLILIDSDPKKCASDLYDPLLLKNIIVASDILKNSVGLSTRLYGDSEWFSFIKQMSDYDYIFAYLEAFTEEAYDRFGRTYRKESGFSELSSVFELKNSTNDKRDFFLGVEYTPLRVVKFDTEIEAIESNINYVKDKYSHIAVNSSKRLKSLQKTDVERYNSIMSYWKNFLISKNN